MSAFFVTGGTLRPDAPCYVERQADQDLFDGLRQGEFCYVLTSRQMGKSSLMVRTVRRLRQSGVTVAVLDLTSIGQNLTVEQWYDGLMTRMGQQLDLEDALMEFWRDHQEDSPLQRWTMALEKVVLNRCSGQVVLFIDEIDIVRSLPFSTDEFFAAIRELYNRRSQDPALQRLAFGLSGVAAPTDLIRDTRMTPFNIGRRIVLNDFTETEATVLAHGLSPDETTGNTLLRRVLYWTGGHPYLTQRLCQALADVLYQDHQQELENDESIPPLLPTPNKVDELAQKLFLVRQARDRDDNLIFVRERLLRSELDVAGLLELYRRIRLGEKVLDNESNPLGSVLKLSGIARGTKGYLRVRNRIYYHVFDPAWIKTNMPGAEVRRQKAASRKGTVKGVIIAASLFVLYLILSPIVMRYQEARLVNRTLQKMSVIYSDLRSYQDTFDITAEMELGGQMVPLSASGSFVMERPNKYNFSLKSPPKTLGLEVYQGSGGRRGWTWIPAFRQFHMEMPKPAYDFSFDANLGRYLGPMGVLPVYHQLFKRDFATRFALNATNIEYSGSAQLFGNKVHILSWEHEARDLLTPLGIPVDTNLVLPRIPATVWINRNNYLVEQLRLDLSSWAKVFFKDAAEHAVSQIIVTVAHKNIRLNPSGLTPGHFFFRPPRNAEPVMDFHLPEPVLPAAVALKKQMNRMIPPRHPLTPSSLVDLSAYFNSPMSETWHPGISGNNLSTLPMGLLNFGGVLFDVRGVLQLSAQPLARSPKSYPVKVPGIAIGQKAVRLHFLHATGWREKDGVPIGAYAIHLQNGQTFEVPIVYGEDVRDWNSGNDGSKTLTRGTIVWNGLNPGHLSIRLFKTTWENPDPLETIVDVDYVSYMKEAAPFLLAITVE